MSIGSSSPERGASDAETRAVFDTNVFGLLTVTRAVGTFRTDFLDASSLERVAATIPDYAETVGRTAPGPTTPTTLSSVTP